MRNSRKPEVNDVSFTILKGKKGGTGWSKWQWKYLTLKVLMGVNIDNQSRKVKKLLKFKRGHRYGDVL